jgi:hypothetical protein
MRVARTGPRSLAGVILGVVLVSLPGARADRPLMSLGELIDQSNHIVIGVVGDSFDGPAPGSVLMSVGVQEILLGPELQSFTLLGNSTDPSQPSPLPEGTWILAFLRHSGPALTGSLPAPDLLEPVWGDQGVMVIDEAAVGPIREIVEKAIKLGTSLRLGDVMEDLRAASPLPPGSLIASLLEELTLRVEPTEAPLLTEVACDDDVEFFPAAQLWAIERVGPLGVSTARPCLETFIQKGENRDRVIGSTEALGELGDPASLPVLLSLIRPLGRGPKIRRDLPGEIEPGPGPGGQEDPEDESDPDPDPGEEDPGEGPFLVPEAVAETFGGESLVLQTEPDGGTEPDDAPTDEPPGRRSDGGLTVASVLALGKIGDPAAVPDLFRLAREGNDLALHSTVVHALGLIGGPTVHGPLTAISKTHPNELVRHQARQTLERLHETAGHKGKGARR